jgi:hypothetical protein
VLRHRAEHVHSEPIGERTKLVCGLPRLVYFRRRQQDLHMRRQEPGSLQGIGGHRHHTARCRRRQIDTTLRDAEQCHSGMRILPMLARLRVVVLGFRQFSAQPMDFALLVEGVAGVASGT